MSKLDKQQKSINMLLAVNFFTLDFWAFKFKIP